MKRINVTAGRRTTPADAADVLGSQGTASASRGVSLTNSGNKALRPGRSLRRRVLDLAWPVIGENLLETMLGIVDMILVAALGAVAIAGVGSAIQIMFFVLAALSALSVGSAVLVAQAIGARDHGRASLLARQALVWSAIISIPLALVGVFLAEPIIGIFGLEPEVTSIGVEYLQVTMGTVVALVLLIIGKGVLRGAGDSRSPMLVTALANVVNIGLSYVLIYGVWGMPALGAAGSAWGTFAARSLALALLLGVLWRGRNGVTLSGRLGWWPTPPIAKQILGLGVPAALEQLLTSAGFMMLTVLVAQFGTATVAAHRLTFTALSFAFLPGVGFGLAATALVGQSIGARRADEAVAAARIATFWALGWMSTFGLLLLLFANQVLRLFTDDPAVLSAGVGGLRVLALVQPFWAVILVQSGALRGAGNTRFPLFVSGAGIWASVLLAALLLNLVGGNLIAVWAAFLAIAPITSTLMWRQFHRVAGSSMPLEASSA